MNLSDWAGSFNLRKALEKELGGTPVALGNDVDLATDAEFEIGAAKQYDSAARRVLGHRRRRRADPRRQAVGRPQDRGRDRPHGRPDQRRASAACGRRGCMEAYAGRGAMEARARRRVEQGEKTVAVQDHGGARPRPALLAASGSARWRATTRWRSSCSRTPSRRSAPASRSAVNLLDPEAVVIGGGLGHPPRRAVGGADPRGDAPAPVRRRRRPPSCSPSSATSAARTAARCSRRGAPSKPAPAKRALLVHDDVRRRRHPEDLARASSAPCPPRRRA